MHVFLSFLFGVILFYTFQYFPFSTISIFLLSSIFLSFRKNILLIVIILSGIVFTYMRQEPITVLPTPKDKVFVRGTFTSYPIQTKSGKFKQTLKIRSAQDMENKEELKRFEGEKVILLSEREFHPGTECILAIRFIKNRIRLNPGENRSSEIYANLLDVIHSENKNISFYSRIQGYRYRLSNYLSENFRKDSGAFIASITIGEKAKIGEDLRNAFNAAGLAHILSISGTHFGIFSVFLFGIFRYMIRILPYKALQRVTIYVTPSQAATILSIPFMFAYLGLSGGSLPAVRSFIMISLFLFGLLIGRKGFWLNSLLFAAFLLTVWQPEVILSLSFQLSFLAVLFIGFSLHNLKNDEKQNKALTEKPYFHPYVKKVFSYFKMVLFLTLSASIGTAPLVAYHFHYFSLISLFSNMLITPLIGFVLIPLSIISSFSYLLTGHYVFLPFVSGISDFTIDLIKLFATTPFAEIKVQAFPMIIILIFYIGCVIYMLSHQKKWTFFIPFLPIVIYLTFIVFERDGLTVTYLDVGQGDSSVIELADNKTVVIDTGRSGRETASFLIYRGKKTVDALVLSHKHPDHTGGVDYLMKKFTVKELWYNGRLILPDSFNMTIQRSLLRGDMIEGEGYQIYILHPYPEFYTLYGNEYVAANNDSLVLKIKGYHTSYLFSGDVEKEAEENIQHLGGWLKSNVLKVPHHGGKTSAHEVFLKTVSPEVAVISVGRDNTFGHPHKEMLDALDGAQIFRTDIDGAIKIKETVKGFKLKTYRDFQFEKAKTLSDELKNIKRLFERW